MKGFFVILAIVVVAGITLYPYAAQKKACYDGTHKAYDDIGYYVAARGLGIEDVCSRRVEALNGLGECLNAVGGTGTLAKKFMPLIDATVSLIRPMAKGIETLKSEHNAECTDYRTYQVE